MLKMAKSWIQVPTSSPFSIANLPFGIITTVSVKLARPAVAIGDHVLCLRTFAENGGFIALPSIKDDLQVFRSSTLNDFASLGRRTTGEVRKYLQRVLSDNSDLHSILKDNEKLRQQCLLPLRDIETVMPFHIGDYTDFYAGRNHAYNVGVMFRGPANALQPNYNHIPVGYHGRASSVVVSGTPIRRPWGQILENPAAEVKRPIFSPSRKLDIELELGAFVCKANRLGDAIPVDEAANQIFGYVLLNDWSARDIQQWEYVPLGPFNGKNFGSTISPWVVHADALEAFRTNGLKNETELLPYLQEQNEKNLLNIHLEVDLTTSKCNTTTVTKTNASNLLFSFSQMLAHHTVGGCPMQVGDLLGSGTISGTASDSVGSLLEQNESGKRSIQLNGGEQRTFLEDGDTITMRGWAEDENGNRIGFGECIGHIEPAREL